MRMGQMRRAVRPSSPSPSHFAQGRGDSSGCLAATPRRIGNAVAQICKTRGHKEVIGQSIEIGQGGRFIFQRHHQSLRAAADRSRDMQMRRRQRAARQNEAGQRLQLCFQAIDGALDLLDARCRHSRKSIAVGGSQIRADVEEIRLYALQLGIDGSTERSRPNRLCVYRSSRLLGY